MKVKQRENLRVFQAKLPDDSSTYCTCIGVRMCDFTIPIVCDVYHSPSPSHALTCIYTNSHGNLIKR